jgi:hypothetical protein
MIEFNNNKFKIFGDFLEDVTLDELLEKNSLTYNDNKKGKKNKKWDLVSLKIIWCGIDPKMVLRTKFEVKGDYISAGSNRVWIEVFGHDGNSGLSTTEADWWIIITGFERIWIKPFEIYRFIETHPEAHNGREPELGSGDDYIKFVYKLNRKILCPYIYSLNDKKKAFITMIPENNPLFWFNCLPLNPDMKKCIEGALIRAKELGYDVSKYNVEYDGKEISSI